MSNPKRIELKMTLQKGDFIIVDYIAKVKETNEVFDTTNEETAKKEHVYKEGELYDKPTIYQTV